MYLKTSYKALPRNFCFFCIEKTTFESNFIVNKYKKLNY